MSKKAHFKGGPQHGKTIPVPSGPSQKIYTVYKVYDLAGFRTKSTYDLVEEKGDDLYYNLNEERFDGIDPTPFEHRPRGK